MNFEKSHFRSDPELDPDPPNGSADLDPYKNTGSATLRGFDQAGLNSIGIFFYVRAH